MSSEPTRTLPGKRSACSQSRDGRSVTSAGAADPEQLETALTWLGLVAMSDRPRPEAAPAIASCMSAGIRPVMITGDHRETGVAIAEEIGLETGPGAVMTGDEMDRVSDEELWTRRARRRLRARLRRAQAPHRARLAAPRRRRGDDRRRRQRRARPAGSGHRRRHGPDRHRGGARSGRSRRDRRQLRVHRGGHGRRAADLREHTQGHDLSARATSASCSSWRSRSRAVCRFRCCRSRFSGSTF